MRLCGLWGAGRLRLLCLARKLRVGCKAPPTPGILGRDPGPLRTREEGPGTLKWGRFPG